MKDEKMDGWIHMPPANYEYQFYKAFRQDYEVYALDVLLMAQKKLGDRYQTLGKSSSYPQDVRDRLRSPVKSCNVLLDIGHG